MPVFAGFFSNHSGLRANIYKKMDLQTFIQSGLLESYVLGQATAEERVLVERMLLQHPEARTELSSIEQAIEQYAQVQAIAPPTWMKGRIMDQLEHMSPHSPSGTTLVSPTASTGPLRIFQLMTVALLLGAAYLWYQNGQIQNLQAQQQLQLADAQTKLNDCSQRTEATRDMVNLIRDADTKVIKLTNGENGKATALLYDNDVRNETGLDLSGLMAPSAPDKYLQFWAVIDGKPVSLGMVQMQAPNGWQNLDHHEGVQFYAISEENNPNGNPTPTVIVLKSDPANNG